jgi:hypothetical protein
MPQRSLSIPSSKPSAPVKSSSPKTLRPILMTGLWAIFFLGLFDVTVDRLFRYPTQPKDAASASKLATYFEYGRSVEGKLDRMIGNTDDNTTSVALAGWLDPVQWQRQNIPTRPVPGEQRLIAFYGQSYAIDVAKSLHQLDVSNGIRMIAGPSAPPNYAYAAYQLDRGRQQAKVVVLGILANSVPGMDAMNGMTWQFEGPAPFTFPRYALKNNQLTELTPTLQTLGQFRVARHNQAQWEAFLHQLRQHDRYYNDFLFRKGWWDNSVLVRMVRRSWAQQHQTAIANQIHTSAGFTEGETLATLRALIREFNKTAKADGKLPVVLLFNTKGYSDHLYQALQKTLGQNAIPYVSTHAIAPASDLSNFVGDGHFTEVANHRIARALLKLINEKVPNRQ